MNFYDFVVNCAENDGVQKHVAGAIIVNEKKEILILSRKKEDFMGELDELPSGTKEVQENLYETIVREVKEETNLTVKDVISYIDSFDYTSGSGKHARQYTFYVQVEVNDEIILTEHEEYKWQTIKEVLNNTKVSKEVKKCIEIYNFNYNK